MVTKNRREFIKQLATAVGGVVLVPAVSRVAWADEAAAPEWAWVPTSAPEGWDPVAFNRDRGNAGAIPESYHASINGEDGVTGHLGKHLPYRATAQPPEGFVAIMWGDPAKGYVRHPNAPRSESNPDGHWYNWIRIRKAVDGDALELQSAYSDWPTIGEADNGAYAVLGEGDINADGGKNTVYLAALPADVSPGDTVRVHAHCLTHGEWVDFITI